MNKNRRVQFRLDEALYNRLIKESMLSGLPIAQIIRLKIQNKKISDEGDEKDGL
ncbi:MAG: hypothetical protein NTZ83_05675 [Candidatus Pacearchaeota archaeon]|nr:hypothetical protein [Candidatus Pacearchaeota archaeon]